MLEVIKTKNEENSSDSDGNASGDVRDGCSCR
jgi:hypothetical protein